MEIGIPLSQDVTFRERNNNGHGTSSTLEFLNHRWPVAANPVAELMKLFTDFKLNVTYFGPTPIKSQGELLCNK
jgi:hypothetical protein